MSERRTLRFRGVRVRKRLASDQVLRPVSAMRPGQLVACSVSLLAAGFLLTRGFIGIVPGRPLFVILGVVLAASAVIGLAIDHVEVRSSRQRPDHALIDEVSRSRRFGHPLSLVSVRCPDATGTRLVGRMRGTDRAWRQRGQYIVMLPETDQEGAARFVRRIADLAPVDAVRLATFPDDAVTVDGLYASLHPVGPVPLAAVDHAEPDGTLRSVPDAEDVGDDELPHAVGER
ncbi:hypothetical protein BH10ACT1_BH10ACT1_22630 [soil metagenome]